MILTIIGHCIMIALCRVMFLKKNNTHSTLLWAHWGMATHVVHRRFICSDTAYFNKHVERTFLDEFSVIFGSAFVPLHLHAFLLVYFKSRAFSYN
jgi:hypothetical protein